MAITTPLVRISKSKGIFSISKEVSYNNNDGHDDGHDDEDRSQYLVVGVGFISSSPWTAEI